MWTKSVFILGLISSAMFACKSRDERMSKLADEVKSSIVSPGNIGGALVVGDTDLTGNRNVAGGLPKSSSSRSQALGDVVLSREQFVVAFDSKSKVPAWTSWQIVSKDVGDAERSNEFRSDEILNKYLEIRTRELGVTPQDYVGSCFDKGHQSPSADRTRSSQDNDATFYMSNMAPQTAFLNRRIWKDLEGYSRDLVKKDGRKLQVYAGSILRDGREGIGRAKDIQVPEAFYKVIGIYADDKRSDPMGYIAVIMPNVTADGSDPISEREKNCTEQKKGGSGSISTKWESYRVILKDIEIKTGVIFPQLAGVSAL
jgi:endonuclease G